MATLVHNAEEIAPRELKPALYELEGISRESVEAHYKLYEGYVGKRNEILAKLADVDLSAGNQVYSEIRALKVDFTFAIGGVKNHEIYFEHLGGDGGDPTGPIADLIERDFGSAADWRADLTATGMAGRGWAWTAYDWDEGRLFNYIGDAQNSYPIWNATPLVALDVYEHAYFLDYRTGPCGVHRRVLREPGLEHREQLGLGVRNPLEVAIETALFIVVGYLAGSIPSGYWVVRWARGVDIRTVGSGNIGATNVWRSFGPRYAIPVIALDVAKGFVPALVATLEAGHVAGALAGGAAMLGHWRPIFLGFAKGGKMVATCGGALFGLAPLVGLVGALAWIVVFALTRYASVSSILAAASLPVTALLLDEPWPVLVFTTAAFVGVLLLHRGNLSRLRAGTETRVQLRRKPARA